MFVLASVFKLIFSTVFKICQRSWIVIFLRNIFTALSDLSGKNSLSKELLHDIGIDPLSSAVDVIVKRAGSDAQHIDWCDWAEIFVQDEFKCNPFLNSSFSECYNK